MRGAPGFRPAEIRLGSAEVVLAQILHEALAVATIPHPVVVLEALPVVVEKLVHLIGDEGGKWVLPSRLLGFDEDLVGAELDRLRRRGRGRRRRWRRRWSWADGAKACCEDGQACDDGGVGSHDMITIRVLPGLRPPWREMSG